MTVLVIGGSGMIGSHVTRALVDAGASLRAMAPSQVEEGRLGALGVHDVVRGDLADPASLAPAMRAVRRLFLLTPYSADQAALETAAVDAAVSAGVEHVVKLSAYGVRWDIAVSRPHRRVEEHLAAAGISHTLLRPDNLLDNLLAETAAITGGTLYRPPGACPAAWVAAHDIGAVAAHELLAEHAVGGALTLTGPEPLTWDELADTVSAATGRPLRVQYVPPDAWIAAAVNAGLPAHYAPGLVELHAAITAAGPTPPSPDIAGVLGRAPSTAGTWARDQLLPALNAA